MTANFPGWVAGEFGTLTLEITTRSQQIRLTFAAKTGLYETYIWLPFRRNQLGPIDSSRERAVRKAGDFLTDKHQGLLLTVPRDDHDFWV